MDGPKVFEETSSSYAAASVDVALKDDGLFKNKVLLLHLLKTHAALNGYEYKI